MSSPCPLLVTQPSLEAISCTTYNRGISNSCKGINLYPYCAPDTNAVVIEPASISAIITIKPGPNTAKNDKSHILKLFFTLKPPKLVTYKYIRLV